MSDLAELYITVFLVGILGIILQIGMKLKSLHDKAKAGNAVFDHNKYFKEDWLAISLSVLALIICMFFIKDAIAIYPAATYYMRFLFATIGYTGSDILTRLFGRASNRINAVINEKTNKADGISDGAS